MRVPKSKLDPSAGYFRPGRWGALGEHEARIDEDVAVIDPHQHAVHANLSQTPDGQDSEGRPLPGRGPRKLTLGFLQGEAQVLLPVALVKELGHVLRFLCPIVCTSRRQFSPPSCPVSICMQHIDGIDQIQTLHVTPCRVYTPAPGSNSWHINVQVLQNCEQASALRRDLVWPVPRGYSGPS